MSSISIIDTLLSVLSVLLVVLLGWVCISDSMQMLQIRQRIRRIDSLGVYEDSFIV